MSSIKGRANREDRRRVEEPWASLASAEDAAWRGGAAEPPSDLFCQMSSKGKSCQLGRATSWEAASQHGPALLPSPVSSVCPRIALPPAVVSSPFLQHHAQRSHGRGPSTNDPFSSPRRRHLTATETPATTAACHPATLVSCRHSPSIRQLRQVSRESGRASSRLLLPLPVHPFRSISSLDSGLGLSSRSTSR